MKRLTILAVFAIVVAGCDDQQTQSSNQNLATDSTRPLGANEPKPTPPPPRVGTVPLPISQTFHGYVLEKDATGFVFQGLSGKKYLLLPTPHLTDKPAHEAHLINYDQIQAKQKLTVRLSVKIPLVPVYFCEGVTLHGVKLPDSRDLTPVGDLFDK